MFQKLFSPDNALMITITQITDCIFLSLFWLLGCVPLVTAGAATAALYDATFRAFRKGEKHAWGRFWKVFRQNWKAGVLPTAVSALLSWTLARGLIAVWNAAVYGQIHWALFSAAALLAVVALGILGILFPVLSRFENSFAGLLKNTVLLSFANMPRTLAVGLVNAVSVILCIRFIFPVFFLPSLAALINSLFIEPMFKPYMPEENAAA